jgi:hypothetical protein
MRNSFQKELDRNRYDSLEKFFDAYFSFLDETYEMMQKAKMVETRVLDISETRDMIFDSTGSRGRYYERGSSGPSGGQQRVHTTPEIHVVNTSNVRLTCSALEKTTMKMNMKNHQTGIIGSWP